MPMFLLPLPIIQVIKIYMLVYMYIIYTSNLTNVYTYITSHYFLSYISFTEGLCSWFPCQQELWEISVLPWITASKTYLSSRVR